MDYTVSNVDFGEIPDNCFISGILVREIVKARPLTREEKQKIKRGGPDILIEPVVGQGSLMNRNEVISTYSYTNGRKINIKGWKAEKTYVIFKPTNVEVAIMQVPLNNIVNVRGKRANSGNKQSGDYIICRLNDDGSINRDTASVVTSAVFRKICYIPPQDIITRHRGVKSKLFDFGTGRKIGTQSNNTHISFDKPQEAPVRVTQPRVTNTVVTQKPQMSAIDAAIEKANNYTVVAQLLNDMGKRCGFVISDPNGNSTKINLGTAKNLCESKKISNMTIVDGNNGFKFFRGIGQSI